MADLLQTHDGLFLGELHDQPALMQSVTQLLPLLKASGVGTVSIELSQSVADSVHLNQSYEDYTRAGGSDLNKTDFALVQASKRLEIKVIGHESDVFMAEAVAITDQVKALRREGKSQEAAAVMKAAWSKWETIDFVSKRDAWAEAYIRQHRQGKVVIIGGKGHSGDYTQADAVRAERDDVALKGGPYNGLDVRLNLPSIDFKNANTVGEIGTTENGKPFSDYVVRLTTDLQKEGITSWPITSPADKGIFNPFEPFRNLTQFPGEQPPTDPRGAGSLKRR